MQTIVYSDHTPENNQLIADRIRTEKPSLFLDEGSEILNPIYDSFFENRDMTIEDLDQRCAKLGWNTNSGEKIYLATHEVGARIKGVEDEQVVRDYMEYPKDNLDSLAFSLYRDFRSYRTAKKN